MNESPKRHNYRTLYLGADLITAVIDHLKRSAPEGKMPQSFSSFVADAVREKLEREGRRR